MLSSSGELSSSPALLLYAKLYNQLLNLAYYCGGKKILSPRGFSIAGRAPSLPPRFPRLCIRPTNPDEVGTVETGTQSVTKW